MLGLKPKVDIFVDPDVRKQLVMFLATDWMGTGLGYSDFILKSIQLWRSQFSEDSVEDTDRCTWKHDLENHSWVSGCGHKKLKRPTNPICPYCVKPLLIHSLSAHQWVKQDNNEKGQNGRED